MWRVVDNNGQWSNIHKTKGDAMDEIKVQRQYDNQFCVYGLQRREGGEWFTIEWFDDPKDSRFLD